MNPTEFYRRISGVLDPARLQARKVAVIGLGSGGCRVAAELGRLGVQLLLVERPGERLEEHNIARHLLGYSSLGKTKLSEMAKYIRNLNPGVQIKTCPLDAVARQEALGRALEAWGPDLIAVCTDNEPSKHAVNDIALRLAVPQTGGAVYDGGIGGEVYRVRNGEACYGCLSAHLRLERHVSNPGGVSDYSNPRMHEAPSTCALNLDIEQIALLQCRITLELLLGAETSLAGLPAAANLCVFSNRIVPRVFARPWHAEFFAVPRRQDCLDCGQPPVGAEAQIDGIVAGLRASPVTVRD